MEAKPQARATRRQPSAVLGEFESTADVLHAAHKVRDAGYVRWDTHTPFPIHGMDRAMGLGDSHLGWVVLACALTGLSVAFLMMHWMNSIDYPINIGDKPTGAPGTLPSMVPILFELTILFSAFGAVFGMFGLNQLPRHNHPVFLSERFRAATDDRFFISIEADDPKFDVDAARALLEGAHATHVEVLEEDES
ncbi:MAG: DUF3341 domain-containing protein [Polyangiaceae bacterium]|nr:DUF3341 domain-containing protein [Polyangiaceae bacterium]